MNQEHWNQEHWTFIALAYGVAFAAIGGLTARIILEHRRLRAELARLESAGVKEDGEAA